MEKKQITVIVNIAMTILYLFLINLAMTGLLVHEILGVVIVPIVIAHLVFNFKWIKGVSKNLFSKNTKTKAKVMWWLDLLITISIITVIVTGIFMSRELFTFLNVGNASTMRDIHISFTYITLILMSIHIGFHLSSIMKRCANFWGVSGKEKNRRIVLRILAVLIVLNGIRTSFKENIGEKIVAPFFKNNDTEEAIPNINEDNSSNSQLQGTDTIKLSNNSQYRIINIADEDSDLESYLGKLKCTGCGRQCSLLSPQCGKGVVQAQQAEETLYSNNGSSEESENQQGEDGEIPNSNDRGNRPFKGGRDDFNYGTEGDRHNGVQGEASTSGSTDKFIDTISIMSIYIAGTHYLLKLLKKR